MVWDEPLPKAPSRSLEPWTTNERILQEWTAYVSKRGAKNTQRNQNVGEAAVKDAESGKTVWHGFKRRDGEPMLVAALVDVDQDQRRWATMVTTEAGPVFSRIHRAKTHGEEREIANLRSTAEIDDWLSGDPQFKHLLRGAGDDFLESWRCPPDAMKKDADPLLKTQTWTPPAEKQKTLF